MSKALRPFRTFWKMKVVAIVGMVGSGKSEIADMFVERKLAGQEGFEPLDI